MLKSFRSRLLLTVSVIVISTTITIMIFAQMETEKAMLVNQNAQARNLVYTMALNIENQYKSLRDHKNAVLDRRKSEAKNRTKLAISYIDGFYHLYKEGGMSLHQAQTRALAKVKTLRDEDGTGYIWINDTDRPYPHMIWHPTMPELNGKTLDNTTVNCLMDNGNNLFQSFVDICMEKEEGYIKYNWPKPTQEGLTDKQLKLSYARLYKEWNWIVGTGFYIGDIERDAQKRRDTILKELRQTLTQVKIAKNGYMFIISGQKEILVHPSFEGIDYRKLLNPITGEYIVEELMAAAKTPERTISYLWNKPDGGKNDFEYQKESYVLYSPFLDWYIGSSVYLDEIEAPGKILRQKLIYLSILFLLIAFLISLWLSRNLCRPLNQLAESARNIDGKNIGEDEPDIPIAGTIETRKLGKTLDNMLRSVRSAVNEKERLLNALETNYNDLTQANEKLRVEIAERQKMENQLERMRSLLSNIINSMPSILVGVDIDGHITQWNLEAQKTTGISEKDARGKMLADLLPQFREDMDKLRKAIRERQLFKEQRVTHHQDNETRFSDVTMYPLVTNGIKGAVIRIDDVTERIRLEEMMVQTEKMMSIGGLAAGMAHEINNPLAGILQNIQVIRNRLNTQLSKNREIAEECGTSMENIQAYMEKRELSHMFQLVLESGQRAANIVENMLEFSRKSLSKFEYRDLCELMDKTIQLAASDYDLKQKYDFRQIEILREYHPQMPPVYCEPSKIRQVFLNLLKNGAQAMARWSQESPDAPPPRFIIRIRPDVHMAGKARIEIEDNGPGIDPSIRKRILDPFFSTQNVGAGTGLGLSVSYFIISEKHKGSLMVESTPGAGSTFIIRLPIDGGHQQ